MVTVSFDPFSSKPSVSLSTDDYHYDIAPDKEMIDHLLGFGPTAGAVDKVLRGAAFAMTGSGAVVGAKAFKDSGLSYREFAQRIDDALTEGLRIQKDKYEADKKIHINYTANYPELQAQLLQKLEEDYELQVRAAVREATYILDGAWIASITDEVDREPLEPTRCFAPESLISMADGSVKCIRSIAYGDTVYSFNSTELEGRGRLNAAAIGNIYAGVTDCFIRLTFPDGRPPAICCPWPSLFGHQRWLC